MRHATALVKSNLGAIHTWNMRCSLTSRKIH